MSRTHAAQPLKEYRLGSTVEAMRKLERKVDRLRHLDGEQLLRAGAEVLTAVLELAEGLSGLCYEIRGLLGLEAYPESQELHTSAISGKSAGEVADTRQFLTARSGPTAAPGGRHAG